MHKGFEESVKGFCWSSFVFRTHLLDIMSKGSKLKYKIQALFATTQKMSLYNKIHKIEQTFSTLIY